MDEPRDPGLLRSLEAVGLVDHHAHGILAEPPATLGEFRSLFSESSDPLQWPHVANAATYRRAIRELAGQLGCEATESAVYERRLAAAPDEYAAALLGATGTDVLLVDDGYPSPGAGPDWRRMGELAGCRSLPVMRIERVAEEALTGSFDEFRAHVREAVGTARTNGFAALKTIAAYRTGLDITPPDAVAAKEAFNTAARGGQLRSKPLLELALWDALEANAPDPLPVQIHAGFGDSDLFLPRIQPGYLKPVVEGFRETPFVLLHCYPYVREAGWLAHVYGNVFFDLSLTIPHVARPQAAIQEALELAPFSKLLYASDAARAPELYFLAARWWRQSLGVVLPELLGDRDSEEAGRAILRENALRLYSLE